MKFKKLATFTAAAVLSVAAITGLAACGEKEPDYIKGDWNNFTQTYTDGTGKETNLSCSLYIPTTYDGTTELPLITYIPDATISTLAATKKAQCPSNWKKYDNSFILIMASDKLGDDPTDTTTQGGQVVPIINQLCEDYAINHDRLYLTGQSKGGIFDFALNDAYPEMFAATVYVSCQMGGAVGDEQYNRILANEKWADQKFIYIASKLDEKAPYGQKAIMDALDAKGATYSFLTDLDHVEIDATSELIKAELDKGNNINIFQYKQVANGDGTQEHMQGFQYGYKVESIYNWLLAQSK